MSRRAQAGSADGATAPTSEHADDGEEPSETSPAQTAVDVVPLKRDSGTLKGKRTTWSGRASVRSALYMAALSVGRTGKEPLAAFHQRFVSAGKPFKVALTAVMRKLLTVLNPMLIDRKSWSAHSVTTQCQTQLPFHMR